MFLIYPSYAVIEKSRGIIITTEKTRFKGSQGLEPKHFFLDVFVYQTLSFKIFFLGAIPSTPGLGHLKNAMAPDFAGWINGCRVIESFLNKLTLQ